MFPPLIQSTNSEPLKKMPFLTLFRMVVYLPEIRIVLRSTTGNVLFFNFIVPI
jgi:hypothetical protein